MLTSTGTASSLAVRSLVEQPSLGHAVIYTTFCPIRPPFQSTPATSPSSQGFTLASALYKGQTFSPYLQFLLLSGQRKLPSTLFGESGASIRGSEQKNLPRLQLLYRSALDLHWAVTQGEVCRDKEVEKFKELLAALSFSMSQIWYLYPSMLGITGEVWLAGVTPGTAITAGSPMAKMDTVSHHVKPWWEYMAPLQNDI